MSLRKAEKRHQQLKASYLLDCISGMGILFCASLLPPSLMNDHKQEDQNYASRGPAWQTKGAGICWVHSFYRGPAPSLGAMPSASTQQGFIQAQQFIKQAFAELVKTSACHQSLLTRIQSARTALKIPLFRKHGGNCLKQTHIDELDLKQNISRIQKVQYKFRARNLGQ